jgi:S-adenosylmethionine uptake transporter
MSAMLFYVFAWTAALSAIPALCVWTSITVTEFATVLLLGLGSNLLFFCSMRALRLIEASATAPYRYVEFLFSIITGYMIFGETITLQTLLGAAIILPTAILTAIFEASNNSKK